MATNSHTCKCICVAVSDTLPFVQSVVKLAVVLILRMVHANNGQLERGIAYMIVVASCIFPTRFGPMFQGLVYVLPLGAMEQVKVAVQKVHCIQPVSRTTIMHSCVHIVYPHFILGEANHLSESLETLVSVLTH